MTLNGVMAITLHYFTEFGKYTFRHITAASVAEVMHESIVGMLISDFSQIPISNLKIRYKSGYRFWLCHSRPENSDSVFPYSGLVVRSLQLPSWWTAAAMAFDDCVASWGVRGDETGQTDWQCTVGIHEHPAR